jgi:predicted ATPase/DNA-binding XRE family transcriptional regulator
MEPNSFGHWLKLKRKALNLTREELAKQVGYSAATIRKIEDEERNPSAQVVERLAEFLNIPQNERADFLRFAHGDWKSSPVEKEESVPWRASTKPSRSNIPATTTSLIAREKEIADVREYLLQDDIRLVTLLGPPGIGKTRLSIEVARTALPDFAERVFFVALAPLDNPALIVVTVAQALGYVSAQNISIDEQLKAGIGDKRMLIVLDNCEHLIEEVASLTSDLLSTCPRLKILTTSRESLRVLGEWLYPVPAFEVPKETSSIDIEMLSGFPALTLFAERAHAVRPDFVLDSENIKTISAICARLDGLPLAIELIAARMRLMSPEALLTRLNDQFILTADGMRAPSGRQKTLSDAIKWSYDLLSVEEQKLFAYLSAFSGSFTLDAAESMFSRSFTGKPVRDLIASLLDKSLLQYVSEHEVRDEPRYTMLVTIQEFARDRLRQMGEELEINNRHLAYFLNLAENADKELRGPNQLEWLRRLGIEVDNLRTSLDWAIEMRQTEFALKLVRKLDWFWLVRGDHTEGRQWLKNALEMPDVALYPEAQAEALTQLAHQTWLQTGTNEARLPVEQSLSIARAHNDRRIIARALLLVGLILREEKNLTAAESVLQESRQFFQDVYDEWGSSNATMGLATLSWREGNWAIALALSQQALAGFLKLGDRFFQAVSLRHVGLAYVNLGDLTNGLAALQESLILAQQLHSKFEIMQTLWRFAEAAQHGDKPVRAVRLYWAARNLADAIGAWWQQDTIEFENNLAACRAALAESAFSAAAEEGRAMTMEQAIAYALEDDT